jgi:hypothetical protein
VHAVQDVCEGVVIGSQPFLGLRLLSFFTLGWNTYVTVV